MEHPNLQLGVISSIESSGALVKVYYFFVGNQNGIRDYFSMCALILSKL